MENIIESKINLTVNNYRTAKIELRNDGDLLNHFASLIFTHYENEIPVERIKGIRKYIKSNTTRMSAFRGDVLYLISILIASLDKKIEEELIQNMLEYMNLLEEIFLEGPHLALTAYVLARYGRDKNKEDIMYRLEILKYQRTLIDELLDCDRLLYGKGEELKDYNNILENINNEILDLMIIMKEGI